MKKLVIGFLLGLSLCWALNGSLCHAAESDAKVKNVVASIFPVYLFTQAVCENVPDVKVSLLVPASAGCPHDFSLRPGDLQKLARADILVINGAGLEDFLDKAMQSLDVYPVMLDAGHGIPLLEESGKHDHDHAHDHAHGNPHIFAAPDTAALMVANIAAGLVAQDPANAEIYRTNASAYIAKLEDVSVNLQKLGETAKNRLIALEHEALAYLAANARLEVVEIFENGLSAAELTRLGQELKEKKPALLAGDSQYPQKLLITLSDETDIPYASLNTCASGPENARPDFYIDAMKKNREILEGWLDHR